jgi:hypothetical protein
MKSVQRADPLCPTDAGPCHADCRKKPQQKGETARRREQFPAQCGKIKRWQERN